MATTIKDAEEKLGKDKIDEITDKDWKVADLPTESELAEEKNKSPKARNNANSRKNLAQYNKKTKQQKEKSIKNLKYVEKEDDIDPRDILGDFADIVAIEKLMPALDVLSTKKEQEVYYNYIKLILDDFEVGELTSSDIDDILTLAINKVIEYRLLKVGAKNPLLIIQASTAIEKFRKFSEKIKGGLASRRVDRIDVKNRPTFSIIDLGRELDIREAANYEKRLEALQKERDSYIPPARDAGGYVVKAEDTTKDE